MEKMLEKGDNLRPKYDNFDFTKLDSQQLFWIRQLTWFTKYREQIENKFKSVKVSTDMKILFIEQHSMKLGNAVFYTMEGSRQKYLQALEGWPYVGGVLSLVYFIGFALKVPMHSKLLKESGMAVALGLTSAALYPYYYKQIYTTNVCTVYDDLRKAIKLNPALAKPDDDTAINKNFGPSKWNSGESGMESDEEIDMDNNVGMFDGHADDDGKMFRAQILEKI